MVEDAMTAGQVEQFWKVCTLYQDIGCKCGCLSADMPEFSPWIYKASMVALAEIEENMQTLTYFF